MLRLSREGARVFKDLHERDVVIHTTRSRADIDTRHTCSLEGVKNGYNLSRIDLRDTKRTRKSDRQSQLIRKIDVQNEWLFNA